MTTLTEMTRTSEGVTAPLPHIPFTLDAGIAPRARIGLIVLATDHTIEHEWRRILADVPGVGLYESRILNDARITPETLAAMEDRLADAASVIMPGVPLDVVAFGCTSAAMVIGEERVAARINAVRPEARVTTPITAAFAAFRALGARRLAVLTPYRDDVNAALRRYVEARGFVVAAFATFGEEDDHKVARISEASIRDAALSLGRDPGVDAVFVACTSLRVAAIAAEVEAALGKPVTSSNHAMAWHTLRLAGIGDALPRWGRLLTLPD
jgi:maleate isomerase